VFERFTLEYVDVREMGLRTCGIAVRGRRWTLCTAIRYRTQHGTWWRCDSSARSSSCALTCAASAVAVSCDAGQHARSSKQPAIHEVEPITHQCAPNCSSTS
jgi:hypothetical protein